METTKNYAFVEITFSQETKDKFSKLIEKIVPENFLYYSPVVERIKGNMVKTLHCTLFYGLEPSLVDDIELNNTIQNAGIFQIQIGKLFFVNGYQDLYKVLCIEVLDSDTKLKNLSKNIASFANDVNYVFKPHLTLAYVINDFNLPEVIPEFDKSLNVEKVKVSLNLDL